MADADLDVVIRQLARQQHAALMAAAKKRRDAFAARAATAKDAETKRRFRHLAAEALAQGTAAAKRLRMSAENAADSYARAMRRAAETVTAQKAAPVKAPAPKPAKPARTKTS